MWSSTKKTEGLCDTPISAQWVEEKLQKSLKTKSKIEKFHESEIAIGVGFCSHVIRLKIQWSPEDKNLPETVILKIPTPTNLKEYLKHTGEEFHDGVGDFLPHAHACECAFYELVQSEGKLPLKVPHCFDTQRGAHALHSDEPGVLVLQEIPGTLVNYADGLNLNQCLQLADSLAWLHCYSLTHDGWRANGELQMSFRGIDDGSPGFWYQLIVPPVRQLMQEWPQQFDSAALRQLIADYEPERDAHYVLDLAASLAMPTVICHGDYRGGNFIFDADSDQLQAIIDWQYVHPGVVTEDFSRMFGLSVNADVRRDHLQTILRHYYGKLTERLGKAPPFSYDLLLEAYHRCFRGSMLNGLSLVAVRLKDEKMLGQGAERQRRVDTLLHRAKCLYEDFLSLPEKYQKGL